MVFTIKTGITVAVPNLVLQPPIYILYSVYADHTWVSRDTRQTDSPRGGDALVTKRNHMRGESILNMTLKQLKIT